MKLLVATMLEKMSKITPSIRCQLLGGKVAALQALGFTSVVTSEKLLRHERPSRLGTSILCSSKVGRWIFQVNCQLKAWVDWIAWIFRQFEHWIFIYCTCICSAIQLVHVSPCEAFSFRKRKKRNMFYNGATAEIVACWGNEWSSMAGTLWEAFQYNF